MAIDRARRESITYFESVLKNHSKVIQVNRKDDYLFEVTKTNAKQILVYFADIYIISEAEVLYVMSEYEGVGAIVTSSNWNSYTDSGKETAKENDIGVFLISEFMGALNYDGQRFLDYLTKAQREALARKERELS